MRGGGTGGDGVEFAAYYFRRKAGAAESFVIWDASIGGHPKKRSLFWHEFTPSVMNFFITVAFKFISDTHDFITPVMF